VVTYINDDTEPDLVTANREAGTISVLLGNGNATFQPHIDVPVGTSPTALAVGDVNSDGELDLKVANRGAKTASIVLSDGRWLITEPGKLAAALARRRPAQPTGSRRFDIATAGLPVLATLTRE
jgi:VCBS repeat protein